MTKTPSPFDPDLGKDIKTSRIALLAFNNAEIMDITGPLDVFAMADRW